MNPDMEDLLHELWADHIETRELTQEQTEQLYDDLDPWNIVQLFVDHGWRPPYDA